MATVTHRGRTFELAGEEPAWRTGAFPDLDALERVRAHNRLGTYVVVGARWASAAVYFTAFCGVRQLVLFEPDAERFLVCRANVRANTTEANEQNRRWLTFQFPAGNGGYACLIDGKVQPSPLHSDWVFLRIDSVVPGAVTLLYLDVPEPLRVLHGAQQTLARNAPLIVMRSKIEDRERCETFLVQRGYQFLEKAGPMRFWSRVPRRHHVRGSWDA